MSAIVQTAKIFNTDNSQQRPCCNLLNIISPICHQLEQRENLMLKYKLKLAKFVLLEENVLHTIFEMSSMHAA